MSWADPTKRAAWMRNRIQERREWVRQQKMWQPCADCGGTFSPEAMDYDHVRGTKIKNLARMVDSGTSFSNMQAEIAKCDLVCANCHRARTAHRRSAP